ncbi:MAG: hypothetical protein ACRC5A_14475 [Enterobacteriaceae bacterium]
MVNEVLADLRNMLVNLQNSADLTQQLASEERAGGKLSVVMRQLAHWLRANTVEPVSKQDISIRVDNEIFTLMLMPHNVIVLACARSDDIVLVEVDYTMLQHKLSAAMTLLTADIENIELQDAGYAVGGEAVPAQITTTKQALDQDLFSQPSPDITQAETIPLPQYSTTYAQKKGRGEPLRLLKAGDNHFVNSTTVRLLTYVRGDVISKNLRAVRDALKCVQSELSNTNLRGLQDALARWQSKEAEEFARLGSLVPRLRAEIEGLRDEWFFQAKAEGLYGLQLTPDLARTMADKIVCNRQNRIVGIALPLTKEELWHKIYPVWWAHNAQLYGLTLTPTQCQQWQDILQFDGIGRIVGMRCWLPAETREQLSRLAISSLVRVNSMLQREAPMTEQDCLLAFCWHIRQSAIPQRESLAEKAKALWLARKIDTAHIIALFNEAKQVAGSDTALQMWLGDLITEAHKSKKMGQYLDALFARQFDSEFARGLVVAPSPAALHTTRQLGEKLYAEFISRMQVLQQDNTGAGGSPDERLQRFATRIESRMRPWFNQLPGLTSFLRQPSLATFRQMLTTADTGFDMIFLPWLAVNMADSEEMGLNNDAWKKEADQFYEAILKARSRDQVIASGEQHKFQVELITRGTDHDGISLHYQPSGNQQDYHLMKQLSMADSHILTESKMTTLERNTVAEGLAPVMGASGSTQLLMYLYHYLASKDPHFSPEQAYLNLLAMLVFDGGHSVKESLVVYKSYLASKEERLQVLHHASASYLDLLKIGGEEGRAWIQRALDNAFARTLDFYEQYAWSAKNKLP